MSQDYRESKGKKIHCNIRLYLSYSEKRKMRNEILDLELRLQMVRKCH